MPFPLSGGAVANVNCQSVAVLEKAAARASIAERKCNQVKSMKLETVRLSGVSRGVDPGIFAAVESLWFSGANLYPSGIRREFER